jgi:hypothetical protein
MAETKKIPCPDCNLMNQAHCRNCYGSGWITVTVNNDNSIGMILLFVLLFLTIVPIALPAAITSLVSSLLLMYSLKIKQPSAILPSYKEAYIAVFWTTATYMVVGSVLKLFILGMPDISNFSNLQGSFWELSIFAYYNKFGDNIIGNILLTGFIPLLCILISALVLRNKMKSYFEGLQGYGRAVITTAIAIMPVLLLVSYIIFSLVMKYYPIILSKYT